MRNFGMVVELLNCRSIETVCVNRLMNDEKCDKILRYRKKTFLPVAIIDKRMNDKAEMWNTIFFVIWVD